MAWVDYDTHARSRPREDVWGQVRRTVRGKPVEPAQIDLIVQAMADTLALRPDDVLLDLASGNGALTSRMHPRCAGSTGVDISPYLVSVAQERFARPDHDFAVSDVAAYAAAEPHPGRFTKALCYGSLSYFSDEAVADLLRSLRGRFTGLTRLVVGNLPDPAHATAFYGRGNVPDLREPRSDIGVWRSPADLAHLAGPGWRVSTSTMPEAFYAASYRFDALLEPVR